MPRKKVYFRLRQPRTAAERREIDELLSSPPVSFSLPVKGQGRPPDAPPPAPAPEAPPQAEAPPRNPER
jgi:hypothetical protein